MKRKDYEAVAEHYGKVGPLIENFMLELAGELGVSAEQAAALSVTALAKKFFPSHDTERSLVIALELDEDRQLVARDNPIFNSRGVPIAGQEGPLLLEVPDTATPFDNPVDAILYSGN